MSDNFDKKLVTKINELFDNYEDHSAVEGWAKFQEKLPDENKKRGGVYWISSVAAALLFLCGLWILFDKPSIDKEEIAKVEMKKSTDTTSTVVKEFELIHPQISNTQKKATGLIVSSKPAKNDHESSSTPVAEDTAPHEVSDFDRTEKAHSETELTLLAILPKKSIKSDSTKAKEAIMIAQSPESVISKTTIDDYKNLTAPEESRDSRHKKSAKSNENITFGVFGGSYMNYAKGSQSSINTGFGFSSEFKISKKISISTGVSIGQNSLEFNREIPEQASVSFARANSTELMDMPASASPGLSLGSVIAPSYNIDTYNAKLTGFDIPVNLKYSIAGKHRSAYIMAGFSSNYFINESYTYDINYPMNYNNESQSSNTQASLSDSQTFNFAKMLNFSLGLDYPINKSFGLSVAPFVKIPVGGMGANDLRFGATGLNLNINFNRVK